MVAGLSREVHALRQAISKMVGLPAKVDQLADTLAAAIDDLAGPGRPGDPVRPVSWIADTDEPEGTGARLNELARWVSDVYMHYPIAARELPDCWLWHPDVVEELAWLHQAWRAAYGPETGTVAAAGDWHDRYRPGVVARIRAAVRMCSLESHVGDKRHNGLVEAPSEGAAFAIAEWWINSREELPPEPSADDFHMAKRRLDERRR